MPFDRKANLSTKLIDLLGNKAKKALTVEDRRVLESFLQEVYRMGENNNETGKALITGYAAESAVYALWGLRRHRSRAYKTGDSIGVYRLQVLLCIFVLTNNEARKRGNYSRLVGSHLIWRCSHLKKGYIINVLRVLTNGGYVERFDVEDLKGVVIKHGNRTKWLYKLAPAGQRVVDRYIKDYRYMADYYNRGQVWKEFDYYNYKKKTLDDLFVLFNSNRNTFLWDAEANQKLCLLIPDFKRRFQPGYEEPEKDAPVGDE